MALRRLGDIDCDPFERIQEKATCLACVPEFSIYPDSGEDENIIIDQDVVKTQYTVHNSLIRRQQLVVLVIFHSFVAG